MFKVKKSGKKIRNCKTVSSAVKALKSGLRSKTKHVSKSLTVTIMRIADAAAAPRKRRRKAKKSA